MLQLTKPESNTIEATIIDPWERDILVGVAITTTLLGALAGALVCWQLWGDHSVLPGFWTLLLTVSALTALPLLATTVSIGRSWVKRSSSVLAKRWFVAAILAAATATLGQVVLCLYQSAITPSGGANPHDLVLLATTVPAGATIGAAVFGVAATILEKLDDPPPRRRL